MSKFAGVLKQRPGGRVKSMRGLKAQPGLVEGYLLTWGNPRDADLEREFFTKRTNLCLSWYKERPCLYHHGLDGTVGLKAIGVIKRHKADNLGLWVQAQLDLADEYANAVYEMAGGKSFGWSSGSVEHLVRVANNGEIMQWPVIEGSITPTPAQPAKTNVFPVKSWGALRGVLDNSSYNHLLRDLESRVATESEGQTFKSTEKGIMNRFKRERIARAALSTYGIKADDEDVAIVAADPVFEEAINANEEGEDDAKLAALLADDEEDAYSAGDDLEAVVAALLADDEEDVVSADDEEDALSMDEEEDAYNMEDDEALMAFLNDDEDYAMEMDEEEPYMARRSGRRNGRRRKKANPRQSKSYAKLAARLDRIEKMQAPGQEHVGRGSVKSMQVTDAADVKGAYENAFKTYLRVGMGRMYDRDKYILETGRDNFGPADSELGRTKSGGLASKTLNIGQDSSVGYAVPPDWINELNKNIASETVMAPLCKTRTTSSDRIYQPNLTTSDARRAYPTNVLWPGESPGSGSDIDATEFTYSQIEIPIHVMLMRYRSTLSALEDVGFDLQAEINMAFAEGVAIEYDRLIYSGSGSGKMQGITTNSDVTGSASTAVSSVGGYIPAGSTSEIISGDVIWQMLYNLPAQYRRNAKWIANSNTMFILKKLKDGDGLYLWGNDNADQRLMGGVPDKLAGQPVVFNEYASDIAANAFPLILADLSKGYTIGQRVDFSIRRFDERYAENDQVLFLGRARVGGEVTQPAAFKALKMSTS